MSAEEEILGFSRVVVVVGLSTKPDRPSYKELTTPVKDGDQIDIVVFFGGG